jgi:hypothetical protein
VPEREREREIDWKLLCEDKEWCRRGFYIRKRMKKAE